MNDEYLEEKAVQYALGTLPRSEVASFEAVLKEDRELQQIVHEFQIVNEVDARDMVSDLEVPFHAYSNIMAEIEGESTSASTPNNVVPFSESKTHSKKSIAARLATWGGWAAAACLLVVLGLKQQPVPQEVIAAAPGKLPRAEILLTELNKPGFEATPEAIAGIRARMSMEDRMIELAELAEAYWFSYDGLPPESELTEESSEFVSRGFTLFDKQFQIGFIGVENLPNDQTGKEYHVWAKTADSRAVRAGTLRGGENSRGLFFFDLSEGDLNGELDGSVSFFVTEETEDRPAQPSNTVILSGI